MESINNLLGVLTQQNGKELSFQTGQQVRLITDSGAFEVTPTPLSQPQIGALISPIMPDDARRSLQMQPQVEFDYQCGGIGNFRVRVARTAAGLAASFRPASATGSAPRASAPLPRPPVETAQRPSGSLSTPQPQAQPRASAPLNTGASAQTTSMGRAKMDSLFRTMCEMGSSDLHLSVSRSPMIRKDGHMQVIDESQPVISAEDAKNLLYSIMPEKNREEFERRHDTDFAYEIIGLARFRANVFMDRKGMGGVFRVIPTEILTAEKLNISPHILKLCGLNKGLVLVTGPTGSGKSTTLCALIDYINRTRSDHIITIEDPIEFVHENKKCLINQREVHNHTDSFKDALRAALREDPDIVLVGEMRDLETVAIAIETAETGHLVFGTLHTTTAASTVDRIIDQFPADRQMQIRMMLSESLRGVISQTLLKKIGGGRVAALEVLIINNAISNLIREGKTFQIASAMQTGRALGNVTLNDALLEHVTKKTVTPEEAYMKAVDKTGFESLLKRNNIDTRFTLNMTTGG
jgi:twitching motility protein PilT